MSELLEAIHETEELTFAEQIEAEEKADAKPAEPLAEADNGDVVEGEADEAEEMDADAGNEGADEDAGEDEGPKLVEWTDDNGKTWQVPEDLTPALFKNKDYTTKTQQLGEERRALEEQRKAFEADAKRTEEDLKIDAELARLAAISSQYDALNWDELAATDLYDAQQKQFQRSLVKEEIQRLSGIRNARKEQRLKEAQSATIKRANEADAYGRANIPGWENGKDRELIEYAREVGFNDEALRDLVSVPFLKMLHMAHLGRQSTQTAKAAAKPAKQAVQPNAKVNGKSGNAPINPKRLADLPIEEYRAAIKRGADPRLSDL